MTRRVLVILGYVLATAIVLGGTVLLIAYGNGYSYDFSTHRLVHRGLIIINSVPGSSQITLNGKPVKQSTPYRKTFRRGWYNFTLAKSGYRTWSKRLEAVPSAVTLADYVLLMPDQFGVNNLGSRSAINQFVDSPDQHHIAFVVTSGNNAGVWSLDTGSDQETKLYASAPATAATATAPAAPAETDTILAWSADNSHLLIKSQTASGTALLVIADSASSQPVNVDTTLGVSPDSLTFSPSNWQQLYWSSPDGLRRLDLGNQTISAPLATNVDAFGFAGSRVVYVATSATHPTQPPALWVMNSDGSSKQKLFPNLPASQSYELTYASYNGTTELVLVAQTPQTATLYEDPFSDSPTVKQLKASATDALFNATGRFVVLSDAQHMATYDLQQNTLYNLPAASSPITGLNWFDNYHLLFNRGGDIVLSEFDGNYPVVVTHAGTLPAFGSSDGKTVFTTAANSAAGTTQIKAFIIR
jgi:hypothetical protein